MMFKGLRITGLRSGPYVLGEPLDVFDGKVHLGRLYTVTASADGAELRLEDFRATDLRQLGSWRTARLIVVEVLSFFIERFPAISAIGIVLSADIESLESQKDGATRLASARAQMLQSVGVHDIHVAPRPHPRYSAHFVVSGMWLYNRDNADLLAGALRDERLAYGQFRAAALPPAPAPRSVLSRLLQKDRRIPASEK
ncbi:MAG: hypothetical protein JSS14_05405 [Proteobacteria bacterium]|nr:hypothetical protein [Pseudomonadota bacterium]